jgi:lysozyme family protein
VANRKPALIKILKHEGVQFDAHDQPVPGGSGWVNNPDDPGKETIWGITTATAREYGYTGGMKDMPYEVACDIYNKKYLDKICFDSIPDQEIAEEILDTAVNCGVEVVVSFLQRTLNVLNKKATLYPDLVVDGDCGPVTIKTLQKALTVAYWYRLCILRVLDSMQCVRYVNLAERDSKFETFMPGWLRNRVGV